MNINGRNVGVIIEIWKEIGLNGHNQSINGTNIIFKLFAEL